MNTKNRPQAASGTNMKTALLSFAAALAAAALMACSPGPDEQETQDAPAEPAGTTAAAQATLTTDAYPFTIGSLDAIALRDGGMEVPNDNKVFGINRTQEDVAGLLAANGLPSDRLALSCQPLLVKTAGKVLLFDTGAGALFGPSLGRLPASMAAAGIDAADVTDIFISHTHGDHVGGLVNDEGALVFPNATIHMSAPEWESFAAVSVDSGVAAGQQAALVAAITPKIATFTPGAELIPGVVEAVEIRGHTPGHSGYRVSSGAESLLYVGDSMHHFIVSVQRPDWTIAFDGDAPTAEASRKALLEDLAESGERVYAVHFPFPGVGSVQGGDGGLEWVGE